VEPDHRDAQPAEGLAPWLGSRLSPAAAASADSPTSPSSLRLAACTGADELYATASQERASRKRLMGLEPTTFCMAINTSEADFQQQCGVLS
jgi:hypothetical protein